MYCFSYVHLSAVDPAPQRECEEITACPRLPIEPKRLTEVTLFFKFLATYQHNKRPLSPGLRAWASCPKERKAEEELYPHQT